MVKIKKISENHFRKFELVMYNLITSCEECNFGKGDVLLNDKEISKFQRKL